MNTKVMPRPLDNILDFDTQESIKNVSQKGELKLERIVQFKSLPIAGWNEQNDILDSKCRQRCVKDCSCVYHCSWIVV